MSRIIKKVLKCAFCKKESTFELLLSYSHRGIYDLDGRISDNEFNLLSSKRIISFNVQECPYCHYCSDYINDENNVPTKFSKHYEEILNYKHISPLAKKFILFAIIKEECGDYYKAGMSYLSSAWIFDDNYYTYENTSNKMFAINFRNNAFKNLFIYLNDYITDKENNNIIIIMVDILRRAERIEEAKEFINKYENFITDCNLIKMLSFEKELIERHDYEAHNVTEVLEIKRKDIKLLK